MSTEVEQGTRQEVVDLANRKLPPVAQITVLSMGAIIAGGIYLGAHLPANAPLGPAVGLLATAAALLAVDILIVSRLRSFAWHSFFLVGKWATVAYLVIGGMLEFIFVFDHTRGSMLVVLSLSLFVFVSDIAMLLAFSVARYQPPRTR